MLRWNIVSSASAIFKNRERMKFTNRETHHCCYTVVGLCITTREPRVILDIKEAKGGLNEKK